MLKAELPCLIKRLAFAADLELQSNMVYFN